MLGERIRRRRQERGLTAQQLARTAGLSPAQMSQIERGNSDPSLDALRRIARGLGTPMFDLFADADDQAVRVTRKAERVHVRAPRGGISYARVSPSNGRLEVLEGELLPGMASSDEPWAHPPSEECVLVTEGILTIEVSGETVQLAEGDSAFFASVHPHRFVNTTQAPVRFTLSVSPPSY